jgi:hypothetical protein
MEMLNPIRFAIFGSISSIRNLIIEKTTNAYGRAKEYLNRRRSNIQHERDEPKYENNPNPNVLDR